MKSKKKDEDARAGTEDKTKKAKISRETLKDLEPKKNPKGGRIQQCTYDESGCV